MFLNLKIFGKGFLLFSLLFAPHAFACDSHTYEVNIKKVIDGDTVVADILLGLGVILKEKVIRLYNIDAPEIRGEKKIAGIKAKAFLEGEIKKAGRIKIRLEQSYGKDKYGRFLGVVYADGDNLNEKLVKSGFGKKADY